MQQVWLSTGSNIGDRYPQLEKAAVLLEAGAGHLLQCSSVYETEPWGKREQKWFLNQILLLDTLLSPQELLKITRETEAACGRLMRNKWEAREMDIDILFYEDRVVDLPGLQIPHPHLHERRFILEPLSEISPEKVHPVLGKTVHYLLECCTDPLTAKKFRM